MSRLWCYKRYPSLKLIFKYTSVSVSTRFMGYGFPVLKRCLDVNDNDTVYERQRDLTKTALETYGVDVSCPIRASDFIDPNVSLRTQHVAGITVGNEFLLNSKTVLHV